jgi:hypothetical protein
MGRHHDITGPYDLTVMCFPPEVGDVKLNTLWHEELSWTGASFGNMDNLIQARVANSSMTAEFSHWESTSGNVIFPDQDSINASVVIAGIDTIIAVFDVDYTSVEELYGQVIFEAYPVPSTDSLTIKLNLPEAEQFDIVLYAIDGKEMLRKSYHQHALQTTIETGQLARGLYVLSLEGESGSKQIKIPLVE